MGIGTAAGIGGIVAGAGSLAGGLTQAGAANNAQNLQAQEAQNALNFQEQQWNTQQQNLQPWLQAGKGGLGLLTSYLNPATPGSPASATGNGGTQYQNGAGSLLQPWEGQFTAPTQAQAAATPGYQFALNQGEQAVQRSAAANGDLLTGGTAKDLTNYAQGLADTNYQQVYNNSLTQYQQAYNQYQQGQANTFNRLAALSGVGQTATGQLNSAAQQAASGVANIDLTTGQQQGNDINLAGAATGSGYVNAANSLGGISNSLILQQLLAQQNGAQTIPGGADSIPGICWVAAELYGGWNEPRTEIVRAWMLRHPRILKIYRAIGPRLAEIIKTNQPLRALVSTLFAQILKAHNG